MPSPLDAYLFDLQGFLKLPGALSKAEVGELNAALDAIPSLEPGQWHGYIHRQDHAASRGINLQQIYEAGAPFESLIDHPSWWDHVLCFVGGEGSFDYNHGPVFIDENFANIRGPGEAIYLHSGGHLGCKRTQFRFRNGGFHCGQINVLLALTDIGPGNGATVVIPGSHKANLPHPALTPDRPSSADGVAGGVEVPLQAGDALLFVDALSHGAAARRNPGERRIAVYRYGPSWGNFRYGYQPSPELLKRLTLRRYKVVQPQVPLRPTDEMAATLKSEPANVYG